MHRPEYVYKYHSASRVAQILEDLTLYFAPASALNDLYEFRAGSLFTETQESKCHVFARRLVHEGWFENLEEAEEGIKSCDFEEEIAYTYDSFIRQLQSQLEQIMLYSGVVCFSHHANNQRMWATYADNHSGAVIEFTTSREKFSFSDHLMPVLYTKSRLDVCPSQFLSDEMVLNQWLCGVFCCIKHLDWRDEGEWRLLMLADHEQSTESRLVSFERSAITRIFLGPRISEEDEDRIRRAADLQSPTVPVFKRIIDDQEAKEDFEGIETIDSFEQLLYWAKRRTRS
jgi:hypothetical protein